MAENLNYRCFDCKNEKWFVAEFTLQGECVVDKHGQEVEGVDSSTNNQHCDSGLDTTIQKPYKCAVCGGKNIIEY